jgi:predicted peptidase
MQFRKLLWCTGWLLFALLILASLAAAAEMTKDEVDFRKNTFVDKKTGAHLPYRLYVPITYSKTEKYPLVLWLHGGGGRGNDNVYQISRNDTKGTHFWISPENQKTFPAFVFAPQCPEHENWADPEFNQPSNALLLTLQALDAIEKEFSIDPDRIYLAGQSMGGLGVYALVQLYPQRWAAALVLSAYDNFTVPAAISRVPLWIFQGDSDQTVPLDMVRDMMQQLKKMRANFRYTEYHKVDHETWNKAFAEPELIPWLSAQKRGQSSQQQNQVGQVGSGAPPANH